MPPSRTNRGKALRKKGVCGLAAVGRACGRPLTTGKSADRKLAEYKKHGIVKRLSKGGVTSIEMAAMLRYEGVSWEDVTAAYVDNGLKTVNKLIKASAFFKGACARTFIIRSANHYITVTANKFKRQVTVYDQRGKIPIETLKNYRIRTILRVLSRGDVACNEVSAANKGTTSEDESSDDFDDSSEDEAVSAGAAPVYKPKTCLGSSSDDQDAGKTHGDSGMGSRGKLLHAGGDEPKRYRLDTSSDSGSSSDDGDAGTASRGKLVHSHGARAKRYKLATGGSQPGPTSPIPEARVPANLGKSPCRAPMDTDTRPCEKTIGTVSRDEGMDTESDPEHTKTAATSDDSDSDDDVPLARMLRGGAKHV